MNPKTGKDGVLPNVLEELKGELCDLKGNLSNRSVRLAWATKLKHCLKIKQKQKTEHHISEQEKV